MGSTMARALAFALALLSVCLALPVASEAASSWRTLPSSTTAGIERKQIGPGETLFMYTTDTTSTLVLDVSRCAGGFDLAYDSNMGGASPVTTSTLELEWCPVATYSANYCNNLPWDVDGGGVDTNVLDGDPATGTASVYGIRTRYLATILTNSTAASVQITGVCWQ